LTGSQSLHDGLIVANHGRHFWVETPDGQRVMCHSRGKKSQGVVGDRVQWLASRDEGTIERIEPRRNLFFRRDQMRTKAFASNLDQVLILIAAEPAFSSNQLSRALIAAEAENITPLIVLNKSDLAVPFQRAWHWLSPYRHMGYRVVPATFKNASERDRQALLALLLRKTTLVLGPSGAGKSTLINLFVPQALALTGELSSALRSGKHTTTSTSWYWVPGFGKTALIDSPGFQEFGLHHIDPMRLARYMPDLRPHADHCRFYNCTHLHEPGCAVIAAVSTQDEQSGITPDRYRIYQELFAELSKSGY
jgi:ribosome biogenesis GTPase / thiamine phosphate phosphatase